MRCDPWLILFVVGLGCQPQRTPQRPAASKADAMSQEFGKLVDAVCECRDLACLKAFEPRYRDWYKRNQGPRGFLRYRYSDRDPRADRMEECMTRIPSPTETSVEFPTCESPIEHEGRKLSLESYGFYHGHPSELAQLKYNGKTGKLRWLYMAPSTEFYWVSCKYEGGHHAERSFPMGAIQCDETLNGEPWPCRRVTPKNAW